MTEATPEDHSRARNILAAVQDRKAKQDAKSASATVRQERVEQTYGPDARKTRDLIRHGRFISLPVLARALIPLISDLAERYELEQRLEAFLDANREYRVTEGLPMAVIDWIGPPNGMLSLPEGAPEHKGNLVAAWHALLQKVNHLSKVGIVKPQKMLFDTNPTAIELLVDLDETPPQRGPVKWD